LPLREVIDRALTLVADKLRSQGVQAVKVLDESDPAAFGDRDELTQVFINLITNTADAMPKGGRLTLRTQVRRQSDIAYVSARVTDTGTGIPEEHREKIFESFFATKPEGKGTGLGLAVTLDILKNHKGTIEVDSELVVDRTRVEDERRPGGRLGNQSTSLVDDTTVPVSLSRMATEKFWVTSRRVRPTASAAS
jgi:signal transduction histidine kinase